MHRQFTCRVARLFSISLFLAVITAPALSDDQIARTVSNQALGSTERFGRYEDSFMVWNRMRNDGWTQNDEWALRAHYSFKYSFCGPRIRRADEKRESLSVASSFSLCPRGDFARQIELFLAYTGEFDFYLGTRNSGPVINRLSAPGLFLRIPLKAVFSGNWSDADSVELGLEHRSNGQVADAVSARGTRSAQGNYIAGNHQYFDTVSRGANYLVLALDRRELLGNKGLDLRAKLRISIGKQDSDVTWGPLANSGRRFSDYDRLDIRMSYELAKLHRLEVQWRVGDKGFETDSWTFGWRWNFGEVPLYLRLHYGPMNTLSNYTQKQTSIGFGLLFSRF